MSGIWAVKNEEENGQVKFQKLSTVSQQIDFTHMILSASSADISGSGTPLAEKIADMAPTRENVAEISSYMRQRVEKAFREAGLSYGPDVKFSVDPGGGLSITGDRSDIEQVRALFESDESLSDDMKTFLEFADKMPQYERMLEYQIKLANCETEAEEDLLYEEYEDLFDGEDHYETSAVFGSTGISMEYEYIE